MTSCINQNQSRQLNSMQGEKERLLSCNTVTRVKAESRAGSEGHSHPTESRMIISLFLPLMYHTMFHVKGEKKCTLSTAMI